MNNYRNSFTEVYVILEHLEKEEYKKIPNKVIDAILKNRNTQYSYSLVDDIELRKQRMLPETKAILFNLFRDYLSTTEQKEKIIRMQREERRKNETEKQKVYDTNVFRIRKSNKL